MQIEGMPQEFVRAIQFMCKNCLLQKQEIKYI